MSSKKTDFGWNENRILYARFGYLHLLGTRPLNECSVIAESGDSLESTHLRLEIVSASSMPNVTFDRHYDVSQSV